MPVAGDTLLVSIHPEHAERIFSGQKTVELRRRRPRVLAGDAVVLYVSSPVRAVMGSFVVEKVVEGKPDDLWAQVRQRCGLSREAFDAYYAGASTAFGIFVRRASRRKRPISLQRLKSLQPGFRPPQGYQYLKAGRAGDALLRATLRAA